MILQAYTIELATFQRTAKGRGADNGEEAAKNNMPMQGLWAETVWPRPLCRDAKALVRTIRQPPIRVPPPSRLAQ